MKFALEILDIYTPNSLKKKVLRDILFSTARAFGVEPPKTRGLSTRRLLEAYALFTRQAAEDVLANIPDPQTVRFLLFQNASDLGRTLRQRFHLRSREDVLKMSRIIYRILGISFDGRPSGDVIIQSCYFSRFYTGDVCRLISALDEGAAAGLSGNGRLEFSQRITDGHDCCRARLIFSEGGR